jgi:hypothetical protein
VIKAAHGVLSPKTSVTPAVNVTSDAHFRHLKGGFKLTVAGQKFQARALCLDVAKNRLIGNRGLSFQPVHPWFDAVITAVIHPAGQPPEHILLEQTDLDGAPEGDGGRVSFEFGNGTVMFHFKGACWRPFLLPVNADGATEIK